MATLTVRELFDFVVDPGIQEGAGIDAELDRLMELACRWGQAGRAGQLCGSSGGVWLVCVRAWACVSVHGGVWRGKQGSAARRPPHVPRRRTPVRTLPCLLGEALGMTAHAPPATPSAAAAPPP